MLCRLIQHERVTGTKPRSARVAGERNTHSLTSRVTMTHDGEDQASNRPQTTMGSAGEGNALTTTRKE